MDEKTIIKEVLLKLDNWVVDIDSDGDLIESNSIEYDDMDFNKKNNPR